MKWHKKAKAEKESVIDFIERQKSAQDLEKFTKERHNYLQAISNAGKEVHQYFKWRLLHPKNG